MDPVTNNSEAKELSRSQLQLPGLVFVLSSR